MRILKLTPAAEKKLLRARQEHDAEAQRVAERIIKDIRLRGEAALYAWVKKLDGMDLRREGPWIPEGEIRAARVHVSGDFLRAVQHAARNVRRVAEKQLPKAWSIEVESGVQIGQMVRPIESIGCYIPGGQFSLLSTLVMTVVPARVAGVAHIQVACPRPNAALLAAADLLGVTRIARIGGVQAIAAFAYGTESVPRVEKIFGPGNCFVTAGKQIVSNGCAIDLPAGPTEAIVQATKGNPRCDNLDPTGTPSSSGGATATEAVAPKQSRTYFHRARVRDSRSTISPSSVRIRKSLRAGASELARQRCGALATHSLRRHGFRGALGRAATR